MKIKSYNFACYKEIVILIHPNIMYFNNKIKLKPQNIFLTHTHH